MVLIAKQMLPYHATVQQNVKVSCWWGQEGDFNF